MIACHMLSNFENRARALKAAAADFKDASHVMDNPREEAAGVLTSMKDTLITSWAKDATELARLTAAMHCCMLQMRRYVCLFVCFMLWASVMPSLT